MKILFICLSQLKFDIDTPRTEPLGGTESAIAYLARRLVDRGHQVFLMANTEEKMLGGVQHLPISEDLAPLDPDVVIVTSAPQAIPAIKKIVPRAKVVLWCHMRPDQPAMAPFFEPEVRQEIENVVYVSESQKESYGAIAGGAKVIQNAIAPFFERMFTSAQELYLTKACRGAYTSTPFRGLAILAHIKELPIDVYSSMRVYQGDDSSFQSMYDSLKKNDCIEMKGSLSQAGLSAALRQTSFLVYPSIFAECHSIAILEAMAAGLKVITTDAASPQTEYIDSMPSKDGSLEKYLVLLRKNINSFRAHPEAWASKMFEQVQHVNNEYTWANRAAEWEVYLNDLVKMN